MTLQGHCVLIFIRWGISFPVAAMERGSDEKEESGVEERYDVVIIGGGVTGAAVARELSRYAMRICLLEKEEDVCSGTSKTNSAIVHAGFDARPGTQKARMNVEGNRMMEQLAQDLDFEFRRNGSLVVCFGKEELPVLERLKAQGEQNGVRGLRILSGDEARKREPNLQEEVYAALHAPDGGIVCPFGLTIALAENACDNGVEFRFGTQVNGVERTETGYRIHTSQGNLQTRFVVNAAGLYADVLHNMVSDRKISIAPRRGSYWLLDKAAGTCVDHTVFQVPGRFGKGVLVTPTVHGNLLVGPTAVDIEDKEDTRTTAEELEEVREKSSRSVRNIPFSRVITSFAGLRAREEGDDFILGEAPGAPGFYDAAGIDSPGLSAAPAIGRFLAGQIARAAKAEEKADFNPNRRGIVKAAALPLRERAELIRNDPAYGTIVCRCEEISEGEIRDAVTRTLGARSMDGIKRRVRAGMGRCQAGFCTPGTMEILARELGIPMEQIRKNSAGSQLLERGTGE